MGGGGLEVGGGVPSEVRRLGPGQAGQGEVNEQFHLVRAHRSRAEHSAGHIQYPPST